MDFVPNSLIHLVDAIERAPGDIYLFSCLAVASNEASIEQPAAERLEDLVELSIQSHIVIGFPLERLQSANSM